MTVDKRVLMMAVDTGNPVTTVDRRMVR